MSDEPKKYPSDTPLTMGLLIEIYDSNGKKGPADFWRKQIEPPTPEPKEGELWLVKPAELDYEYALWRFGNRWFYRSDRTSEAIQILTPIKRLIPQEGTDE